MIISCFSPFCNTNDGEMETVCEKEILAALIRTHYNKGQDKSKESDTSVDQYEERTRRFIEKMCGEWKGSIFAMLTPTLVEMDSGGMSLTMAYPVHPWENNSDGVVHGGIMATMIDTTMGTLTHAMCGIMTPTIHLDTSYLRPAPGDGTILIRAHLSMLGHGIIYADALAWDSRDPDAPVAQAQGTFRRRHNDPLTEDRP